MGGREDYLLIIEAGKGVEPGDEFPHQLSKPF